MFFEPWRGSDLFLRTENETFHIWVWWLWSRNNNLCDWNFVFFSCLFFLTAENFLLKTSFWTYESWILNNSRWAWGKVNKQWNFLWLADLLDLNILERFMSLFAHFFVNTCQSFCLLVRLSRNQLKLFWPDKLRLFKTQNFLSSFEEHSCCHLIAWKSFVFETCVVSEHFIKDFIAFGWYSGSCLFGFKRTFNFFTFKENSIGNKHFNEVNGKYKTKVPSKEIHQHPFSLNDICPRWIVSIAWSTVILLHVINEDELIINLIVFRCNQETGSHDHCYQFGTHLLELSNLLRTFIKKIPVK